MLRYPTRSFVYPLVYLVSAVPVTIVTLVLTVTAGDTISSFLHGFEGDFILYGYLTQTLSLLVTAIPVYGLLGLWLYSLEETSRPPFLDHLRRGVFLYGLFFATLVVATLSYQREIAAGYTQPVGPGANITPWVAGCVIQMNLLALLWRRSRSDESGGEL